MSSTLDKEERLNLKGWQRLLAALCVLAAAQLACGQRYTRIQMDTDSMKPNFSKGDILTITEVPLSELKRGDVVLIDVEGRQLVKRLIALPNETISIAAEKIFIDGVLLVEPYQVIPGSYSRAEIKLSSDSYYVLGDNRADSYDSHIFGPIKGSNIKGQAILPRP